MKLSRTSLLRRSLFGAVLTIAALLVSSAVFAFGTVNLKSTNIDEVDGRWKLQMDINYGSEPHMGHIPFDFVFTLQTYYEYSITDTDKEPQVRRKPMVNQTPTRESVDIDFADARGKIWPRTKFQIDLKRERQFESGEYTLVIKRASDGAQMGNSMHITLNGKNALVDRRSIVFSGPSKKSKDAGTAAGDDGGSADSDASAPTTDKPPEGEAKGSPEGEEGEAKGPPPVPKKQGGCGCRLSDSPGAAAAGLSLAALGFATWLARRRRRR